ncbi:MAG: hypothetical protein AAF502_03010 [Bacteroidota bacterium]
MKTFLSVALALSFLMQGCPKNNQGSCDLTGVVKDFTGLDGCKHLIILDDGTKLEPVSYPADFVFKDRQQVKLSYESAKDVMTICMSGETVKITCIEETGMAPEPTPADPCVKAPEDPMKVPWMKNFAEQHKTEQILTFEYNGKPVYFFKILRCCDFQSFLKDCQSNNICIDGGITGGDCHPILSRIDEEAMTLIWKNEGSDE